MNWGWGDVAVSRGCSPSTRTSGARCHADRSFTRPLGTAGGPPADADPSNAPPAHLMMPTSMDNLHLPRDPFHRRPCSTICRRLFFSKEVSREEAKAFVPRFSGRKIMEPSNVWRSVPLDTDGHVGG